MICKLNLAKIMFKFKKSQLPSTFKRFFISASEVHHYATRSTAKSKYYTPKFRLVKLQKSLKYRGVHIWNDIDEKAKSFNINRFEKEYKNKLLQNYI